MEEPFCDSDDEFVEFEEDDGEIVVIKSYSQLLKEANEELERRQEQINILHQNASEMESRLRALEGELSIHRNIHTNEHQCDQTSATTQFRTESPPSLATSDLEPTSNNSISSQSAHCSALEGSPSDSMDDFCILANDKSCQTDDVVTTKKVKHKATQTRFEKQLQGIFQGNLLEASSDNQDSSQLLGQRSNNKISLSNALGWSSAFKEVGLNMICHLKQTMDPFNMTCTLDNETTIKDFENLIDSRMKMKNPAKTSPTPLTTVAIDNGCQVPSDGNANQKTMVTCPYCNEEMESCSIQRHIQSMCGALELLPLY